MSRELTEDEMLEIEREIDIAQVDSVENTLASHDNASGHTEVWRQLVKTLADWRGNSAIQRHDALIDQDIHPDRPTVFYGKYNEQLNRGHKLDFGGRAQNSHIRAVHGSDCSLLVGYGTRKNRKVKRWQRIVAAEGAYAVAGPLGADWTSLEKDGRRYWVDDNIAMYLISAPDEQGQKRPRSDSDDALANLASTSATAHSVHNAKEALLAAFAIGDKGLEDIEAMWGWLKPHLGPKAKLADVTDMFQRNVLHIACTEVKDWRPNRPPEQRVAVPPMPQQTRMELINWLLRNHPTCLSKGNDNGSTPLGVACSFGNEEVVTALLGSKPATIEVLVRPTNAGWTALHIASTKGHEHIVELLLDALIAKAKPYAARQRAKAAKKLPGSAPSTSTAADTAAALTGDDVVGFCLYDVPSKHYKDDTLRRVCEARGLVVAPAQVPEGATMAAALLVDAQAMAGEEEQQQDVLMQVE